MRDSNVKILVICNIIEELNIKKTFIVDKTVCTNIKCVENILENSPSQDLPSFPNDNNIRIFL